MNTRQSSEVKVRKASKRLVLAQLFFSSLTALFSVYCGSSGGSASPEPSLTDAAALVDVASPSEDSSIRWPRDATTPSDSEADVKEAGPIRDAQIVACWEALIAKRTTTRTLPIAQFGAFPNDGVDDTEALRAAFASRSSGARITFSPGIYTYSDVVFVEASDLEIDGTGATFQYQPKAPIPEACPSPLGTPDQRCCPTDGTSANAQNYAAMSLFVRGARVSIHDLELRSALPVNPYRRGCSGLHYRIYAERASELQLYRNRIYGSAAAGILLGRTQGFLVAGNTVERTNSDAIHISNGSGNGIIVGNRVRESGDDMIAIVSYANNDAPDSDRVRNVLIQDNDVEGAYWGRGITVVGGGNITIRRNRIRNVQTGAGVLIHRESSYNTFGVDNVLVEDNEIEGIQTDPPTFDPKGNSGQKAGHAAIDLSGQEVTPSNRARFGVENILIRRNRITRSKFGGLALVQGTCDVHVEGNAFVDIRGPTLRLREPSLGAMCGPSCSGNSLDGTPFASSDCTGAAPTQTTGAAIECN
jgi:Right handed beta helix region